jgi:hypothetical protein
MITQNRRILLSSIGISYTITVISNVGILTFTSLLNAALSNSDFSSHLSIETGVSGLGVQGSFAIPSNPTSSPLAATEGSTSGTQGMLILNLPNLPSILSLILIQTVTFILTRELDWLFSWCSCGNSSRNCRLCNCFMCYNIHKTGK